MYTISSDKRYVTRFNWTRSLWATDCGRWLYTQPRL